MRRDLLAIAAGIVITTGCEIGGKRDFPTEKSAVAALKLRQQEYENLALAWRTEGQRELCRVAKDEFQWNDISVRSGLLGWKLRRTNQTNREVLDLNSLEEAAGILGTTSTKVSRFLQEMETLKVACISNVGVTLGDREGSYVQMQLSPYVEMYGYRFAPEGDVVSSLGLKKWSEQQPDSYGRRTSQIGGPWYYFEGLTRTAALPLSAVNGTLKDIAGYPLGGVRIQLALSRSEGGLDWAAQATTGRDGRFEFLQVPAGSYVVGLNLFHWSKTDAPFPRTYFPGVRPRELATVIALGEGRKVDVGEFRVPFRVSGRRLVAEVVWNGGRPEPKAQTQVCWDDVEGQRCKQMSLISGGKYETDAADGVLYHVTARYERGLNPFGSNGTADPVRVPAFNWNAPVKLVLR